jgi:excisionase family DNA binding protein
MATTSGPSKAKLAVADWIWGTCSAPFPEAAAALRISRSSIYRLFEAGELAWVPIGASRPVTSAEIHRFIAAHTEAAS